LTRLIRSLALKTLIRNLWRHSTAPSPGHMHTEVPLKSVRTSLFGPTRTRCLRTDRRFVACLPAGRAYQGPSRLEAPPCMRGRRAGRATAHKNRASRPFAIVPPFPLGRRRSPSACPPFHSPPVPCKSTNTLPSLPWSQPCRALPRPGAGLARTRRAAPAAGRRR
jgi:hypothetical protein